jgi:diguanylate cyclase (GGDEF)-like protein
VSDTLSEIETRLQETKSARERLRMLLELCDKLAHTQPKRVLRLAQEAHELAHELGDREAVAESLFNLGFAQAYLDHHRNALSTLTDLLALAKELGLKGLQGKAMHTINVVYDNLGNYEQAHTFVVDALKIYQELGDEEAQARCLNSIGVNYAKMGDHQKALEYYERSHALQRKLGDELNSTIVLSNIGVARKNLGRFDEAIDAHREALEAFRALDHKLGQASALTNLAIVHDKVGRFAEAFAAYHEALAVVEETGSLTTKAEILRNLGKLHHKLGQHDEALEHFKAALAIAEPLGIKPKLYQTHRALARLYKDLGDFERAYVHLEEGHRIEREVFNESSEQRVKHLQIAFELEQAKKEKEIYRLRHIRLENALRQLESLNAQLEAQSVTDPLTGLYNRRYLDRFLRDEFTRRRRYLHPLAVAIADIDFFKRVNDKLSHAVGDEVLKALATIIRDNVREVDVVARYGGEEFVIAFPETSLAAAKVACEKVRAAVEAHAWEAIHPELKITLSIGVAEDASVTDHEKLLNLADIRLYEAKRFGKNQVRA